MKTNNKLPKAFKTKWIKALRSGDYKQGTGLLYTIEDNTYCCMGVCARACADIDLEDLMLNYWLSEIESTKGIPKLLLNDGNKNLRYGKTIPEKLVRFNDYKNWSFNKIASYIERYL